MILPAGGANRSEQLNPEVLNKVEVQSVQYYNPVAREYCFRNDDKKEYAKHLKQTIGQIQLSEQ